MVSYEASKHMIMDTTPYLRRDLVTLAAIVVIIAIALAALSYFELTQGLFTALAEQYLPKLKPS